MDLIVCSSPENINHEQDLIKALVQEGMTTFHLRKPDYTEEELRIWLEQTNDEIKSKLVIHSHWTLAEEYKLKGIHLGVRSYQGLSVEEKRSWTNKNDFTISTSIHDETEYEALVPGLEYVWLSPVFKSISKSNYVPALSDQQLDELASKTRLNKKTEVYALGGIQAEHIPQLCERGFDGVVVLGALWQNINGLENLDVLKARYHTLKSACEKTSIH
jgi:thiamine-phosphate pyrophosphorylase